MLFLLVSTEQPGSFSFLVLTKFTYAENIRLILLKQTVTQNVRNGLCLLSLTVVRFMHKVFNNIVTSYGCSNLSSVNKINGTVNSVEFWDLPTNCSQTWNHPENGIWVPLAAVSSISASNKSLILLTLIGLGFFTCLGLGFFYMFTFLDAAPSVPNYLRCLWTHRNEILYRDWQSKR